MNLEIDRPMASLFFEIKRNMPYEEREHMKIASPDIANDLIKIYHTSEDPELKTLIENFMGRAGSKWEQQLEAKSSLGKLNFLRRVTD